MNWNNVCPPSFFFFSLQCPLHSQMQIVSISHLVSSKTQENLCRVDGLVLDVCVIDAGAFKKGYHKGSVFQGSMAVCCGMLYLLWVGTVLHVDALLQFYTDGLYSDLYAFAKVCAVVFCRSLYQCTCVAGLFRASWMCMQSKFVKYVTLKKQKNASWCRYGIALL